MIAFFRKRRQNLLAQNRLVFQGAGIPVEAGRYRITIDLAQDTHGFAPID